MRTYGDARVEICCSSWIYGDGRKGNGTESVEGELPYGSILGVTVLARDAGASASTLFLFPSHMVFLNHVPCNLILYFIIEL